MYGYERDRSGEEMEDLRAGKRKERCLSLKNPLEGGYFFLACSHLKCTIVVFKYWCSLVDEIRPHSLHEHLCCHL